MKKINEIIDERLKGKKKELREILAEIEIMASKDSETMCFENNMMNLLLISKELKVEIRELELCKNLMK